MTQIKTDLSTIWNILKFAKSFKAQWLTIDNNHIKKLDISQNTKLIRVSAVGNNLNNNNIIKAKNTQHAVKIDLVEEQINNLPPLPPPPSVR